MVDLIHTTERTARYPHRCDTCEMEIARGARYRRSVCRVDRQLVTYREHPECQAIGERSTGYADPDHPGSYDAQSVLDYLADVGEDGALAAAETDAERERIRAILAEQIARATRRRQIHEFRESMQSKLKGEPMLDLEPIKARLAAATPGPWYRAIRPDGDPIDGPSGDYCTSSDVLAAGELIGRTEHTPDAALIAHAPTDIAALIAEVERLRATTAQWGPR